MGTTMTITAPGQARTTETPNALTGFHPEMPRPRNGISVWQMADGETALAFVAGDGVGAMVASDTDDVIFWDRWGARYHFIDLPDSAVEFRSVWNVDEHAEAILHMARRTLGDWRASLRGESLWLRDPEELERARRWRIESAARRAAAV